MVQFVCLSSTDENGKGSSEGVIEISTLVDEIIGSFRANVSPRLRRSRRSEKLVASQPEANQNR